MTDSPMNESTPQTEEEWMAMQVAYLVAKPTEPMPQDEIRRILQLKSQAKVSRLLGLAIDRGWVKRWSLHLPTSKIEEIEQSISPKRQDVLTKLAGLSTFNGGVPLSDVTIVHVPSCGSPAESLNRFGHGAAEHVGALLRGRRTRSCAVAWGTTIKAVIDGLLKAKSPSAALAKDFAFLPVSGEPLGVRAAEFSPTADARRLAEAFGCSYRSLAGAVARIPKDLAKHHEAIRSFVSRCADYNAIFGEPDRLIGKVDMILTSVGDAETSSGDPWFEETQRSEGIDLNAIAAGNVGGVWIPRDPADRVACAKIADMNDRWLGMQETDLRACAKRAADGSHPGVVVVAASKAKVQIVARAIGTINHLVIDRELAQAILDLPVSFFYGRMSPATLAGSARTSRRGPLQT